METTMLKDLINPEVMADMISAKIENAIRVLPYAKVDTTLQGRSGDTITIPKFKYIGDAVLVEEGANIPTRKLGVTSENHTIKKIGKGVTLTDEAVLSGHGNPVGEANNQLAKSIISATETDGLDALYNATTTVVGSGVISYANIVNAIDAFEEEINTDKVMFIHPKQVSQLRLDPMFISAFTYTGDVVMTGEIGKIANTRVVASRRIKEEDNHYLNPIVQLESDTETQDDSPALTVFLKRGTNVETDRIQKNRTTEVTVDKLYVAALTNDSKVVIMEVDKDAESPRAEAVKAGVTKSNTGKTNAGKAKAGKAKAGVAKTDTGEVSVEIPTV